MKKTIEQHLLEGFARKLTDITEDWQKANKRDKKEGVAEGTRYTGNGIHPKLVEILKQRGYKGPYQLGKLKKWFVHLKDDVNAQATDEIMVTGNDVEYDEWVLKEQYGEYAFGSEGGYMTGDANRVIKNTAPMLEQGTAETTGDPKFDKMIKGITGKKEVHGKKAVAEGWTHDSLAAELFEMPTYENRLREMLEGQVSFLEGGTEERVTMASKKPGSQHHLNDADQGNIDDMHLRSVHPSDKGDKDEYGMEGEYLRNELHTIMRVCKHLEHSIDDSEDLPTWVIDKMSQAKGMIVMVMDYLISEKEETLDKQSGKEDHMMK